jgi:hypothetical protein
MRFKTRAYDHWSIDALLPGEGRLVSSGFSGRVNRTAGCRLTGGTTGLQPFLS